MTNQAFFHNKWPVINRVEYFHFTCNSTTLISNFELLRLLTFLSKEKKTHFLSHFTVFLFITSEYSFFPLQNGVPKSAILESLVRFGE